MFLGFVVTVLATAALSITLAVLILAMVGDD
jgi:hypothetical protein